MGNSVVIGNGIPKIAHAQFLDHNYRRGLDPQKVKALQRLVYNLSERDAGYVDGKWGVHTLNRLNRLGIKVSDDLNSYTYTNGDTYEWKDGQGYVKKSGPKAKNRKIGIVDLDNLTDLQARDRVNYMKSHKGASEEDWANAYNQLHKSNLNDIKAGKAEATAATALMAAVAAPYLGKALYGTIGAPAAATLAIKGAFKPKPFTMAPEGGNAFEGLEFINVRKNGGKINLNFK